MKEQFVTYEIALALKELKFDENCMACFGLISEEIVIMPNGKFTSNREFGLAAPLWQQVIDWFIEKHKINCVVGYVDDASERFMAIIDKPNESIDYNLDSVESYYEAREQAILKAIELIKKCKKTQLKEQAFL